MSELQSKEMTRLAIEALEDKKAEDIRIIDISEVSVLADYFLIASGTEIRSRLLQTAWKRSLDVPDLLRSKLKAIIPQIGSSWITVI